MAVYFYYGDEEFNIELKIKEMKSKLNPDFVAMSFQVFDNPDYQKLITVLRTPPMMFGDTLIIINCDKYLTSQKNYFEENELKDIENALDNNVDTVNALGNPYCIVFNKDKNEMKDYFNKLRDAYQEYKSKEKNSSTTIINQNQ